MNVSLERFAYTQMGVFGRLTYPGGWCYTLEEVWRDNVKGNSCIPIGMYRVQLGKFGKDSVTRYEVQGVPGRTYILIHPGNTVDDVEGCIVPGTKLGTVNGLWAVVESRNAFDAFMASMQGVDVFTLSITNLPPQGILK